MRHVAAMEVPRARSLCSQRPRGGRPDRPRPVPPTPPRPRRSPSTPIRWPPLADAERAFARETAKVGIRAGFLAWFARDSIGFRPALGNAWDQINARPAPPNPTAALLEWEPRVGDVAASGELGWLTGPSTFTAPDGSKHYGNYLSVWVRRPEGWRVFIDVGADAPSPVAVRAGLRAHARGGRPLRGAGIARRGRHQPIPSSRSCTPRRRRTPTPGSCDPSPTRRATTARARCRWSAAPRSKPTRPHARRRA